MTAMIATSFLPVVPNGKGGWQVAGQIVGFSASGSRSAVSAPGRPTLGQELDGLRAGVRRLLRLVDDYQAARIATLSGRDRAVAVCARDIACAERPPGGIRFAHLRGLERVAASINYQLNKNGT